MEDEIRKNGEQTEEGRLLIQEIEKYEKKIRYNEDEFRSYTAVASYTTIVTILGIIGSIKGTTPVLRMISLVGACLAAIITVYDSIKAISHSSKVAVNENEVFKLEEQLLELDNNNLRR